MIPSSPRMTAETTYKGSYCRGRQEFQPPPPELASSARTFHVKRDLDSCERRQQFRLSTPPGVESVEEERVGPEGLP